MTRPAIAASVQQQQQQQQQQDSQPPLSPVATTQQHEYSAATTTTRTSTTTLSSCNCPPFVLTNERNELFHDFMEHGELGLHIVNNQGIIVWANQAELDLLGYQPEEYIGQFIHKFHADLRKIDYILSVLLGGGKLSNYTAPIKCKNGRTIHVDITSSMRRVNGEYTTSRCFSVCVANRTATDASSTATDLVSSEETQEQSASSSSSSLEPTRPEEDDDEKGVPKEKETNSNHTTAEKEELAVLFEDFMEFGSVGLHIVDSTGIIRWANKAEMDLLGYTREEYIGKSVTEVYADAGVLQQLLTTLLSGKKLVRAVTPLWAKDGHIEYVEINSSMRKVNGQYSTTRCFSTCVTDRVMREKEHALAMAKQAEAEASKAETRRKTDFLRKLCHELRNPLAGVAGNLELLVAELHQASAAPVPTAVVQDDVAAAAELSVEEKLALAEQKLAAAQAQLAATQAQLVSVQQMVGQALGYAESAQLAAEHQMLVVNDTLSLSRLESEGFDLSLKPVDLNHVLDSVNAILGVKAQEKSIQFTITNHTAASRAQFVRTDPVWLKQILINLVSNSIKFSDANNGRVDLVVSVVDDNGLAPLAALEQEEKSSQDDKVTLQFAVTDNGIGMTKEEQGRLFGVFSQANERISSQFGGSGLGLYIVKELLEHVGGSISVQSEKGEGSSFIVHMPVATLSQEERAKLILKYNTPLAQANANSSKNGLPPEQNKKIRVLVVDDSRLNRRMLVAYLRKRGYTHEEADNGQVALKMHEQMPFDVILTDVDMPIMDGNELTRNLRRKERQSSCGNLEEDGTATTATPGGVTIIGISGNALPDDISAAKENGMDEYLSKPFNFKQLEALMLKHIAT